MKKLILGTLSNWQKRFYTENMQYYVGFEGKIKTTYRTRKEALKEVAEIQQNTNPNDVTFEDRTQRSIP